MNILIVAATMREIEPLIEHFRLQRVHSNLFSGKANRIKVDCLCTGIGLVATTFQVTKMIQKTPYRLIVNAGIAGTFRDDLPLGSVVEVTSEQFADFGIDDNGIFRHMFEEKFLERDEFPFNDGRMLNPVRQNFTSHLPETAGISVSTTTGSDKRITLLIEKFKPDIESMEGAAIFYVGLHSQIPFIEIRAISNKVEPRNRENWNISLAIEKLNSTLIGIFDAI
ncbi:MAG: futalosine hydrolase [Bacteroidota bacterium]|nr:futalosine hydrolase [Bacteroidota bacterium]